MSQRDDAEPRSNRTLFVAARPAAEARRARRPDAPGGSDLRRPARLGVAAAASALGTSFAFALAPVAPPAGPGPLTPPHLAAGLRCESCHGDSAPGREAHLELARGACTSCHGAHASVRPGHQRLARRGELGCASCHTIHGEQGGVALPAEGVARRYGTRGERRIDDLSFHAGRELFVPVVAASACLSCHTDAADDPFERCRSPALRGSPDEPSLCFDEHRRALPTDLGAQRSPRSGLDPERGRDEARTRGREPVCRAQHQDDRAFAWEAARHAVLVAPSPPVGEGGGSSGWLALGAGLLAGIAGWFGASPLLARTGVRATRPSPDPTSPAPTLLRRQLPVIDTSTCLGCYACVDACPYDVLAVERYVAVVVRPEACCGLVLCEQRCPNGSLHLGEADRLDERPALGPTLESAEVPGLFLAGDVTGLPLIKNAIHQGARAAEHAAASAHTRSRPVETGGLELVDVCVIGAGPAGISAALRLAELGASSLVLEQGGVAQSIQSFPRGKLVFDQPLELPVHGKLWLEQATKEELLSAWMRIVRKAKLPIEESTRVIAARRRDDGLFEVDAEREGAPLRRVLARSLVLSVGQRGSPRKLDAPIAEQALARVHYHLADARSLAGRRLVIVGLGDVAMEAAVALANQPGTSVTIVHRGATYTRGQSRNVQELERLRKSGKVRLIWGHRVARVDAQTLDLTPISGETRKAVEPVPFDHLLVLIGGTRPWALLEGLGMRRPDGPAGIERGRVPTA